MDLGSVSMTLILLVGAGLLGKSFYRLLRNDIDGFGIALTHT